MAKKKQAKRGSSKRKVAKVNKSQEIRDYSKSNPSHKPSQIAAALGKKGISVSPQFVSTILSTSKRKRVIRKPGRPKGSGAGRRRQSVTDIPDHQVSVRSLLKVKKIVAEMGGIDEARLALNALEKLMA